MRNVFGTVLTITLFGESHGKSIGTVIDGISPGVKVDEEYIRAKLAQRRPAGRISTRGEKLIILRYSAEYLTDIPQAHQYVSR